MLSSLNHQRAFLKKFLSSYIKLPDVTFNFLRLPTSTGTSQNESLPHLECRIHHHLIKTDNKGTIHHGMSFLHTERR